MLISCPECNRQISDKAFACPGCGLPMTKTKRPVKTTKRMRLPNGFGPISEASTLIYTQETADLRSYTSSQDIVLLSENKLKTTYLSHS